MILDTSAIIAVIKREPAGAVCQRAMRSADRLLISAGTLLFVGDDFGQTDIGAAIVGEPSASDPGGRP